MTVLPFEPETLADDLRNAVQGMGCNIAWHEDEVLVIAATRWPEYARNRYADQSRFVIVRAEQGKDDGVVRLFNAHTGLDLGYCAPTAEAILSTLADMDIFPVLMPEVGEVEIEQAAERIRAAGMVPVAAVLARSDAEGVCLMNGVRPDVDGWPSVGGCDLMAEPDCGGLQMRVLFLDGDVAS